MVLDPKYGSCSIAMPDLTPFFKRFSPYPLMKAQGATSVGIFVFLLIISDSPLMFLLSAI